MPDTFCRYLLRGKMDFIALILIGLLLISPSAWSVSPPQKTGQFSQEQGSGNYHPKNILIGIPDFWGETATYQQWQPLADYLQQSLPGYQVKLKVLTLPEMEAAIESRSIDFIFTNPSLYVLYTYRYGLSSPLATLVDRLEGESVGQFAGVIFTRQERTDLNELQDLKGSRIAAVSASSLAAYQMQRLELQKAGMEPQSDFRMVFTGLPLPKVVDQVISGQADAGFIRAGVLEELVRSGQLAADSYRIISPRRYANFPLPVSTDLYPEWPFAALPHLDHILAARVSGALLSMPLNGEVSDRLGIAGFTVPGDYRVIDQLLRTLKLPPFDQADVIYFDELWQQIQYYALAAITLFTALLLIIAIRLKRINRDLHQSRDHIHHLAYFDTLTGLPNRQSFLELLQQRMLAGEGRLYTSLLIVNIDRFKLINNARGSDFADHLLHKVGERLQQLLPKSSRLFRLSGDEFAILTDQLQIPFQVEELFREPIDIEGEYLHLSLSIGATRIETDSSESPEKVLGRASTALYTAKQQGGQQTVHFEAVMADQIGRKFQVEKELPRAIENNELRLFLQSQVDAEGQLKSAEVLVRWQHPEKGLLSPLHFIPVAEESNLIVDLGSWVLEKSCALIQQLQEQGCLIGLSVNISPRHFRQANFIQQVSDCLERYQIPKETLTLEVTENLVIDDVEQLRLRMLQLRQMGVRLSIDDFGTGYSSLAYLKRLPVCELKIDQSFVQGVTQDPDDAALVDVVIAVAANLKLDIVAEGVETETQAAFLNSRGRVLHQGYLYSKPTEVGQWRKVWCDQEAITTPGLYQSDRVTSGASVISGAGQDHRS